MFPQGATLVGMVWTHLDVIPTSFLKKIARKKTFKLLDDHDFNYTIID
jgi:hypothetical protein